MSVDFLYCIDDTGEGRLIRGWLLATLAISEVREADPQPGLYRISSGLPRPDVAVHFPDLPGSASCGIHFELMGDMTPPGPVALQAEVITADGSREWVPFIMDLGATGICQTESAAQHAARAALTAAREEQFRQTLAREPRLTLRLDITNKCNLRCIMCHYREEEIRSRPPRYLTAETLQQQISGVAPYVRHIMLSCGFEPLVSKHFIPIVQMLNREFPHMEIGLCTNGMLLDSAARKAILEYGVTHVILSLDGATRATVERIRVGASYDRIIANIMALRDLKRDLGKTYPLLFMDFVLMNSNIHEAPAFVELCAKLGMELIDFRHLVGNVFFSEHEEMLQSQAEKFDYYREKILEAALQHNMKVRLPEPFGANTSYTPMEEPANLLADFHAVTADEQKVPVTKVRDRSFKMLNESAYDFLSEVSCQRPFSEIMIGEEGQLMPCSYYGKSWGEQFAGRSLQEVFLGEDFRKVRERKMLHTFDHHCLKCPIRLNLLPTKIENRN